MTDVALVLVLLVIPSAVCVLKGKPWFALLGLSTGVFALAGALLWAKPNSWWARRFYSPKKMGRAEDWFRPKSEIGSIP